MKLVSWLLISTGSLVIVGLLAFGLSGTIRDALTGHVEDIVERTTIEDKFIEFDNAIAKGNFRTDDIGQDAAHWVKGSVSIVNVNGKNYVQLNSDFEAGLAPDLYLYVSTSATPIVDERSFFATTQLELGKLVKGTGASFYEIPAGIKPSQVTIWCKRFSQFMGSATVGKNV